MKKRFIGAVTLPYLLCAPIALAQAPENDAVPPPDEVSQVVDDPTMKLSLEYDVPPECPSREEFFKLLSDNSPPYRFAFHEVKGELNLQIKAIDAHFEGTATLQTEETSPIQRKVEAPTCTEVLNSLSVMLGFRLRPLVSQSGADSPPSVTANSPAPNKEEDTPSSTQKKTAQPYNPQHGGSLTRRPAWAKKVAFTREKETSDGPLKLQTHLAFDAHFGITAGLLKGQPIPRMDITARTALFLTSPGDRAFLMGFIPRIRFNAHFSQHEKVGNSIVELSGLGFGLGGCLSPYYDPNGFVVLACADYGGSQYQLFQEFPDARIGYSYRTWSNKVNLSLETEYHVGSHFFAGLRGGLETNSYGHSLTFTDDDELLFEPGRATFFMTAGAGVQF